MGYLIFCITYTLEIVDLLQMEKMNPGRMLQQTITITMPVLALWLITPVPRAMAAPTAADARQVLNAQLQKLTPVGVTKRTVLFETVTARAPSGGYYPFIVTATIHDYSPGYPANRFYGETCVGRMDKWTFDLRDNGAGSWIAQGRMTVSDRVCHKNPSEGVSAVAADSLPGKPAEQRTAAASAPTGGTEKSASGNLYLGEYACYGTGGRLMAGMGFRLLAGGKYIDLDSKRGGSYRYDTGTATVSFSGGFLDGQKGSNVRTTGFQISSTVNCEPWR
jgi:hypothetical protein